MTLGLIFYLLFDEITFIVNFRTWPLECTLDMHLKGKAGEKEEKREKRKKPSKQRTEKVFTVKTVYGHDADKQSFWLKRQYVYV